MPTAFETEVLTQLGQLSQGQEQLSSQVSTIFHKLEGNGQPGLCQRITSLEVNCRAIQEQKAAAEEEEDSKSNRNWGMYAAIAGAVLGPLVVIAFEIMRGI